MVTIKGNIVSKLTKDIDDVAREYSPKVFLDRVTRAFDGANRKITPIDTGDLQRTFKSTIQGNTKVKVQWGGRVPGSRQVVDYAQYVEERRPFIDRVIKEGLRQIPRIRGAGAKLKTPRASTSGASGGSAQRSNRAQGQRRGRRAG